MVPHIGRNLRDRFRLILHVRALAEIDDIMDEKAPMDRTPYNERADYREVEADFRSRLESLVPNELADRIETILKRREKEYLKNTENKRNTGS